jgi:hypothetical protein
LDLPSIVWKQLIGDEVTEADVLDIDRVSFKLIDEMKKIESQGVTAEDFNSAFSETRFLIAGSDAKEYELIPGGKDKVLTWENRKEFCRAIINYRKSEFRAQCDAIKRGLATVIPYSLLSLFTWEELEVQVCGRPVLNVDLLMKMTEYGSPHSANALHIKFFWQVIKDKFDEVERAKFLKFVWGRSRLPVRQQDFETKFKINALHKSMADPDKFMPISHTCFFSLDLPCYTSQDVMHKRLLYAITHCESIDADMEAGSIQVVREDDSEDDEDEE